MSDGIAHLTFTDPTHWDAWLSAHAAHEAQAWPALPRKGSGLPGPEAAEAGDIAIAHGWIDSHRRRLTTGPGSGKRFLPGFSPRRAGSPWSRVNVARVATPEAAGRMRPGGLAEVAAARADGRRVAAYARSAPRRSRTISSRNWNATAARRPRSTGCHAAGGTGCSRRR